MFEDIITKEHIFLDKRTKRQKIMNIGLIILFIGIALAYIVFQLVPLFSLVLTLDKERGKITIDDWLFFSLLLIVLLIPMAGAIIGLIFKDEDNKWLNRIALISVYIIIIGSVIFFVTV